jgi:hypothetical protein
MDRLQDALNHARVLLLGVAAWRLCDAAAASVQASPLFVLVVCALQPPVCSCSLRASVCRTRWIMQHMTCASAVARLATVLIV